MKPYAKGGPHYLFHGFPVHLFPLMVSGTYLFIIYVFITLTSLYNSGVDVLRSSTMVFETGIFHRHLTVANKCRRGGLNVSLPKDVLIQAAKAVIYHNEALRKMILDYFNMPKPKKITAAAPPAVP